MSVRIIEREDSDATISVLVADGFGAAIERLQDIGMEPGVLEIDLDEGIYLIGVSGRKGDRALRYELTPLFEAEPIASTPEIGADAVEAEPIAIPTPRYRRVDTEVLEIEGKLSSPTGVLLDIGSDRGVVAGMRGELSDDVDIVSEIEIVDVYDGGSRAVISLPMNRPITPSVRATLLFPADSEPGFESSDMMSPNDRPSPTD